MQVSFFSFTAITQELILHHISPYFSEIKILVLQQQLVTRMAKYDMLLDQPLSYTNV